MGWPLLVAKWPSLSTSRSRHQAADAQHATRGYAVPIVVDLPDLGNADNVLLRHQRAVRYLKPDAVDAHAILRAGPLVALVVLSINALLSLDLNPRRPVRVLQPTWRRQTSSRDRPWRSGCASFKLLLARLLKTSAGPRGVEKAGCRRRVAPWPAGTASSTSARTTIARAIILGEPVEGRSGCGYASMSPRPS
jgi:hypothetical protein